MKQLPYKSSESAYQDSGDDTFLLRKHPYIVWITSFYSVQNIQVPTIKRRKGIIIIINKDKFVTNIT